MNDFFTVFDGCDQQPLDGPAGHDDFGPDHAHAAFDQHDFFDIHAAAEAAHFSPEIARHHDVAGDPGHEMMNWHEQHSSDTCGIVAQEFVLHDFGITVGENRLTEIAERNGYYHSGAGTPLYQVGSLLDAFGLPVRRESHLSLDGLIGRLEGGDKVIVAVDAHDLWHDSALSDLTPSFFHQANHVVQVTGAIDHGTSHAMIVLNDPGHSEGRGMVVPEADFLRAWETSDCFAASVPGNAVPSQHPAEMLFPALRATVGTAI